MGSTKKKADASTVAVRNIDSPPQSGAPAVPRGFVTPTAATVRKYAKPSAPQRAVAPDLADELRSSHAYASDLGKRAPDPTKLSDRLVMASAWESERLKAESWSSYCGAMAQAAWDAAMRTAKPLAAAYKYAARDESSIATTYPHTAAFFGARTASAARARQTKRAKK